MKHTICSKLLLLAAFVLSGTAKINAQCHACTDPAPYTGQTVCGLPEPSLSQPSTTCLAATNCSGSSYSYTISFPSKVKAYFVYLTGGVILDRMITADIISQPYTSYNCSTAQSTNEFGTSNGNVIYNVRFTIRWTSTAPKFIEVYAYTGPVNTMTATVAYYKCFSIAASGAVPATPASVGLSSPVCSTTPKGWLLGNQSSPGATYYTWSGAVSGTYTGVTGPFIAAGQTATFCVAAGNACGLSAPRCNTMYIPNICGGGFFRQPDEDAGDIKDDNSFRADINIYPNPASGRVSVYLKQPGKYTVSLVNTSGQQVLTSMVNGQTNHAMDVSKLSKGVYLVTISENGVIRGKQKILIQ